MNPAFLIQHPVNLMEIGQGLMQMIICRAIVDASCALNAGTNVRFRLGGHRFPPEVYFKIFTHRPLCDVNSFAPRDYNSERKSDITLTGINKTCATGETIFNIQISTNSSYSSCVLW